MFHCATLFGSVSVLILSLHVSASNVHATVLLSVQHSGQICKHHHAHPWTLDTGENNKYFILK